MTLVEVVVVIGIISIALPALFSTLIVSTRQQVSISRINEVKNQGDSVLGTMTSRIKNDAQTLCMSTDGTTCGTKLCETADGAHDMNSFIDKSGGFVRYYADTATQSLYEYSATASVVPVVNTKRLTNDRVKVSSFALQCQKVSETTRPIVSIQYSVLAESTGNTKAEDRATLDYSTKIAVDHIDTVALQVLTDSGSTQLTPLPTDASGPTLTPRPTSTPTPIPVIEVTGGTITIENGYKIHTFTTSGTLVVQSNVTADALIVAGGGGGGYAISGTNESGGGGGGGGVGSGAVSLTAGTAYTITVGGGGRGGLKSPETKSASGSSSSLVGGTLNEVAYGGGRGGDNRGNDDQIGGDGGSGGGGAGGWGDRPGGSATKGISSSSSGATITYYGNAGVTGPQGNWGGGGGGAGGAGSVGVGGAGYAWSVNSTTFGAGGSINQTANGDGVAGGANTGNGGGAGAKGNSGDNSGTSGAAGGSGIVIIRYPYNPTVYHPIAGHVTNAATGAAISGVAMVIEYTPAGATSTSTATVVTDATGYYSLTNTVPLSTLYTVRMQTLTGGSMGKSGYYDPHLTAPPERIYDTINLHHTYRHDTPVYRDSQTTDASYERQYAGQNDCASAIAAGWNYPAGRCDFKLSTIVPPTLTPTPTPIPQYTYRQIFLSRDGATEHSRSCNINTSTGIDFANCEGFGSTSITNLRATGNERYSDWASTVYTLPNAAYDAPSGESTRALLPAGTQILISTLLATDGTSTYTRSCPLIIANSTSRCWPRSWAATTLSMYNLGNTNFGDGAGKSYAGIDFVAYPRVFNGQLRQAFRRWFVRSDEKTYISQQCYIRASIDNISDPISWGTECMNDSGTLNAYSISDRTTDANSGFKSFYEVYGNLPTASSVIYPKGSSYELLQMGINSTGDWTWNRNAQVDPYYLSNKSGFIFASPAVLNDESTLAATRIPTNLRGIDGYVIKY